MPAGVIRRADRAPQAHLWRAGPEPLGQEDASRLLALMREEVNEARLDDWILAMP